MWTLSGNDSFRRKRCQDDATLKPSRRPNLEEPFLAQKAMMVLLPQILWESFQTPRKSKGGVQCYPLRFQQFDSLLAIFCFACTGMCVCTRFYFAETFENEFQTLRHFVPS